MSAKFLPEINILQSWLSLMQITELCLEFICFDPNYNYGSDDEDDDSMDTNDQDDDEG